MRRPHQYDANVNIYAQAQKIDKGGVNIPKVSVAKNKGSASASGAHEGRIKKSYNGPCWIFRSFKCRALDCLYRVNKQGDRNLAPGRESARNRGFSGGYRDGKSMERGQGTYNQSWNMQHHGQVSAPGTPGSARGGGKQTATKGPEIGTAQPPQLLDASPLAQMTNQCQQGGSNKLSHYGFMA